MISGGLSVKIAKNITRKCNQVMEKFTLISIARLVSLLLIIGMPNISSAVTDPALFYKFQLHNQATLVSFMTTEKTPGYQVYVHSRDILPLLHSIYSSEQIKAIEDTTASTRKLTLIEKPWGTFIQATSFINQQTASDTHYNAVWVRDSLWGYLALNAEENLQNDAKRVLLSLWDYMSVPEQLTRMTDVILNPELIKSETGQMNAVHIRFDSDSATFSDVMANGEPQQWNHKQNDAIGLFLDLTTRAIENGQIKREDWLKGGRLKSFVMLIGYLNRIHFYQMEDSGSWEEEARLNTSSVALVTSAFESLKALMADKRKTQALSFNKDLKVTAKNLGLEKYITQDSIETMISKGYQLITNQLLLGGESPDYRHNDINYRTADAALLNLIYPAKLSRLSVSEKKRILSIVNTLSGSYGIKRYLNDDYQSANFWFNDIKTDVSKETHGKRVKSFIPFTEAQWFFDSWYANAALQVYQETGEESYLSEAYRSMNRSVGQITGKEMIGANGCNVEAMALPESYNFITYEGKIQAAPSPIIPLNWSKASLTLMLSQFKKVNPNHGKAE